jgi:hypothetical protein
VLEAEGFEHRGSRKALLPVYRRYTELPLWVWSVLGFSWEDVMLHPEWALWAIRAWVDRRAGRLVPAPPRRDAAA